MAAACLGVYWGESCETVSDLSGATIGKCALYPGDLGPDLPSAYLIRLLRLDIVDARYVMLFLLSPDGQEQLLSGRTATAQPNINSKAISDIQILVPDLKVQRQIVRSVDNAFLVFRPCVPQSCPGRKNAWGCVRVVTHPLIVMSRKVTGMKRCISAGEREEESS